MMLVTVLCSFSVLFGKCFLKKTQHNSLYYLGRKWSTSFPAYVAAILGSVRCYRLDSREKLIKATLQGGSYLMLLLADCFLRLAPSLETENAINFFHKRLRLRIIPLLGNKISSRNRCQINEALAQIATKVGGIA